MLFKASVSFFVLVLISSLLVLPALSDQIKSDFSVTGSLDGWSVFSDWPGASTSTSDYPKWMTGGFLSVHDYGPGYYWLVAPSKFVGNLSGYVGGSLSYQMRYDGTVASGQYKHPSVVITRGNQKLWKRNADPARTFTNFEYKFNSSEGWMILTSSDWSQTDNLASISRTATDADIAYVLAAVDNIYLRGDMCDRMSTEDAISLDNVCLANAAVAATPEPSSLLSLIGGLGAFGAIFARLRKR